jgi:hypothetical protein
MILQTQTDWWFHLGMFLGEASKLDEHWLRDKLMEIHQYAHMWDHWQCYEILTEIEQRHFVEPENDAGTLLHNLIRKYPTTFGN